MSNRDEIEDFLHKLYNVAWDMYEYQHSDVWRGQKYYTTLNVAIISIALTLLGIPFIPKNLLWVVIPLFFIGMFTSLFGYLTIRKLRAYFLQAIWYKVVIENALEEKLNKVAEKARVSKELSLTPVFCLPREEIVKILPCPQLWINQNVFRKGGVTFYFIMLQIVFFLINIMGILLTILLCWVL